MEHSILGVDVAAFLRGADGRADAGPILGVDQLLPRFVRAVVRPRRKAVHCLEVRRPAIFALTSAHAPFERDGASGLLREIEHVLARAQFVLDVLALGDVGNRACPSNGLPALVAQTKAREMNPAQFAARKNAHFRVESRGTPFEVRGQRLLVATPVLGMEREAVEKFLSAREPIAGIEADHFQQQRRCVELVGGDVPVEMAVAGGLHRQRIAPLRKAQRSLGGAAFGDVGDRRGPPDERPGRVARAQAGEVKPSQLAVAQNAHLLFEPYGSFRKVAVDRGNDALPIVRMIGKPREVVCPSGEPGRRRHAAQLEEARRRVERVGRHDPVDKAIAGRIDCKGEPRLAAAEGVVRFRELLRPPRDELLEAVLRLMQRLLGFLADGDLGRKRFVLPCELLEHAVHHAREVVELARAVRFGQPARQVALDNGRRHPADALHLEEHGSAHEPADERSQCQRKRDSTHDAEPEVLDERLEARALAADENVIPARQHEMRGDDAHRGSVGVDDQPVGAGSVRNVGRPRRQVAGKAPLRRVGEHEDLALRRAAGSRIDGRNRRIHTVALERAGDLLHVVRVDVGAERRQVLAPHVPERNREQAEHDHAQDDVADGES